MIQKDIKIIVKFSIAFFVVCLMTTITIFLLSSNKKLLTKAQIEIINLKRQKDSLKTSLDSIRRIQNDSLYKLFLIEKSCDIDFNKCSNQFKISHLDTMKYYCKYFNVPERIFFRLVYKESRFDSTAYHSKSYAMGYCQITPVWWYGYHCNDYEYNEVNRIKCSLRGLNELYEFYGGNWREVLSFYNSGNANNNVNNEYVNWILR